MGTYYVRNDGESTKINATDPTSASSSMSVSTFNTSTFSAGDTVYFSSRGGNLTTGIILPSSGTDGNEIIYAGETDHEPTITASGGFDQNGQSHVIISDITVNSNGETGFHFDGTDATNITTTNLSALNISNQGFQHLNNVSVVHNNIYAYNCDDEGFSSHDTPTVIVNGGIIDSCTTGMNWVGSPTFTINNVEIKNSTNRCIELANSGGTYLFDGCICNENPDLNVRAIDCTYGSWVFQNCIFLNLTDSDFYLLYRSTISSGRIYNCTFMGDSVNTTTAIFNQVSGGVYKNNIFVDCGTQALWGTTGTIDYNLFYNSGTAKGTNTVTTDPNLDSDGLLQSDQSSAVGAGIGPSSDSNVPTTDINGVTRSGTTCDIGAAEYTLAFKTFWAINATRISL